MVSPTDIDFFSSTSSALTTMRHQENRTSGDPYCWVFLFETVQIVETSESAKATPLTDKLVVLVSYVRQICSEHRNTAGFICR